MSFAFGLAFKASSSFSVFIPSGSTGTPASFASVSYTHLYNILTLNKIAAIGTSRLGDNYKYGDDVQNPDAVLVRSAAMHDMELADNLLAIARAGAGTNNIPKDKCSEQGIVV